MDKVLTEQEIRLLRQLKSIGGGADVFDHGQARSYRAIREKRPDLIEITPPMGDYTGSERVPCLGVCLTAAGQRHLARGQHKKPLSIYLIHKDRGGGIGLTSRMVQDLALTPVQGLPRQSAEDLFARIIEATQAGESKIGFEFFPLDKSAEVYAEEFESYLRGGEKGSPLDVLRADYDVCIFHIHMTAGV